jgi:hypothetical protein
MADTTANQNDMYTGKTVECKPNNEGLIRFAIHLHETGQTNVAKKMLLAWDDPACIPAFVRVGWITQQQVNAILANHSVRDQVITAVNLHVSFCSSTIASETGLPIEKCRYHLNKLEKEGHLYSWMDTDYWTSNTRRTTIKIYRLQHDEEDQHNGQWIPIQHTAEFLANSTFQEG